MKMHAEEVDTSPALVRELVRSQFPEWADYPVEPVLSAGTDNALFRLGKTLSVRLPRVAWAAGQVDRIASWLPRLAHQLPLATPELVARGKPGAGYPWDWAIFRWIPGESAAIELLNDPNQSARAMAVFLNTLNALDATGGPGASEHNRRGTPLAGRDEATRQALRSMEGILNIEIALEVWENALQAPDWKRAPVWFHGDMLPGNILVENGQICAVIDWSGMAVGDPACDLMIAWGLFSGECRRAFRAALNINDDTWRRGRGHALSQAVIFIPYYLHTNPIGVAYAQRQLAEVLADFQETH
jgi:aminoglycoside phosphotransferase (APT) family kinase protein